MKAHRFALLPKARRSTTSIPWVVCKCCGLILLKNAETERARKKSCGGLEDPEDFKGWD